MRYAIDENEIQANAPWIGMNSAPSNTMIIAVFSPGFNSNLSRWSLFIQEDGTLLQRIKVNEYRPGQSQLVERREQSAQIETEFINNLLAQAIAIIDKPPVPHSGWMMTDTPVRTLTARIEGQLLDVPDYEFTDDYRNLWEDVHRFAPYNPWRD